MSCVSVWSRIIVNCPVLSTVAKRTSVFDDPTMEIQELTAFKSTPRFRDLTIVGPFGGLNQGNFPWEQLTTIHLCNMLINPYFSALSQCSNLVRCVLEDPTGNHGGSAHLPNLLHLDISFCYSLFYQVVPLLNIFRTLMASRFL